MGVKAKISETVTERIFRAFYGVDTFLEKTAIPVEYGFKSKNKNQNDGYPDFFLDTPEYAIVVEAKATKHELAQTETVYYMEHNKIEKDIVGIAVSGQSPSSLKVTYFLLIFGNKKAVQLDVDDALINLENIRKIYFKARHAELATEENLTKTLHSINKQFHDDEIVRDTERSLFFSGIMIALKDDTFRNIYSKIQTPSAEDAKASRSKLLEAHLLNEAIVNAITRQLESKINNLSKEYNWRDKFSFIKTIDYPLIKYKSLISKIEKNIFLPFENEEKQDILGRAYKIFLSKAGKVDNKNIILTPDHIKSLMIRLARLSVEDVVLDTCTGSGGFLMEAMETMIAQAKGNETKINEIKDNQLIGFEIDSVLFALACSNMFLHGDGRTNLIYRSSLLNDCRDNIVNSDDEELLAYIKKCKPTKVIINPPYENNKSIKFALQAIEYLESNGNLIIIMPTPTLTHNQGACGLTEKLLSKARLDFVIRMPEKLFSEQKRTVNTSIFGFTKTKHNEYDTVMFYDLSDDGFVSIQHKGRIDKSKTWPETENSIVNTIFAHDEIPGICEKRPIYKNGILNCAGIRAKKNSSYEMVKIGTLFKYQWGSLASESSEDGKYDFVTASAEWKKHSGYSHDCEALVYAVSAAGSLGRTHYVNSKFVASNLCIILTPKSEKHKVDLRFYKFFFNSIREQIRSDLADGTSKLTISPDDLMEYYIEYVPYEQQLEFYNRNIVPYEQLANQLKNAEECLQKSIIELSSGD